MSIGPVTIPIHVLGHALIATTHRYTHVSKDHLLSTLCDLPSRPPSEYQPNSRKLILNKDDIDRSKLCRFVVTSTQMARTDTSLLEAALLGYQAELRRIGTAIADIHINGWGAPELLVDHLTEAPQLPRSGTRSLLNAARVSQKPKGSAGQRQKENRGKKPWRAG